MSTRKLIIGGIIVIVAVGVIIGAMASPKSAPVGPVAVPGATASAIAQGTAASSSLLAAASSASSAVTGGNKVGDRIKVGDEEWFAITEVDPTYAGSGFIKPAADKKWVAVLVEIEGIDPNGASYNPFYFKARDDQGFEYTLNLLGKEPTLKSSNDLQAGARAKGWVTFEVPSTVTSLTLIYAPALFGEPVEVKVL